MTKLTNDEIALYDRQIRLWGLEAQAKIKTAKILVINLSAVGTEIVKNLMLGGVGSLSIIDDHKISSEDLLSQYYILERDIGKYRLDSAAEKVQELNPRVKFVTHTESVDDRPQEWFAQYDLVVATQLTQKQILRVNGFTRALKIPFYSTGVSGLYGHVFVDLIEHRAIHKKEKLNVSTKPGPYFSFSEIEAVSEVTENNTVFENITTKDVFRSYAEFLKLSNTSNKNLLELYFTRRKLKKISPIFPLVLASLNHDSLTDFSQAKSDALKYCENLSIPPAIFDGKDAVIQQYLDQLNLEFAPVAAIIGGTVAQDVINALGHKGKPINNFVVLDGISGDMQIFRI